MNSFQLLTIWIVGSSVAVGCLWLLTWAGYRWWFRLSATGTGVRQYRIDGQLVEISVADGCSVADLRALFESIRDDPALPSGALLLFNGSERERVISDADVHTRMAVFLAHILRPA